LHLLGRAKAAYSIVTVIVSECPHASQMNVWVSSPTFTETMRVKRIRIPHLKHG
jgi:hypothetical protein